MTTAELAVRISLTGHLVLSTLHSQDAPGVIARLSDMTIEPRLISSSVIGILSQRLVRILCPESKVPCEPEDMEYLNKKGLRLGKNDTPYKPLGCAHCMETGYKGRTGLFELLHIDSGIRSLIEKKAPMEEILVRAKENGMIKMKDYGWEKVKNGTTTIDEVERVLQ
jgi:type II secretory ATPase GspE/PulE/Tfp pilus assembly ATPase PilB-like protein